MDNTRKDDASAAVADKAETFRWKGTWNEFTGKVKRLWGTITEDDLKVTEGRYEQLLGRVQKRTGEAMDSIRKKLLD